LVLSTAILPSIVIPLGGTLSFVILIGLTTMQTYQFAASVMEDPDYRLGLISAFTPLSIIALLILTVIIVV
ncbi:MAG: hypothetical protein AAF926_03220, partial [Pseudomonadota bacterium]